MATDRTMSTTWRGTLMEGAGTIHEAPERRLRPARRQLGLARRGAERARRAPRS